MTQVRPLLLIVEKDEATRELYRRELSRTYSVITTENAQQALEVLKTHEVAAVILEPATSDDAGWDLISSIRHLSNGSSIRVILCSALDERRHGMSLGAAAYLVKPVLPMTLLDTLNHVLQG